MSSPTSRSLELLKADGWTCQIVEKWNPFARVRQDLFGFIDIVCLCPFRGILGVQTTTKGKMKARITKIKAEQRSVVWLQAGGHIIIHGWAKGGKRSPAPGKWACTKADYVGSYTNED